MTRLPQIMVAPNGARKRKADHPAVPITQDEVVACAQACFAAGAGAIHAHIRDADEGHLLDAAIYQDLVTALRQAVPRMAIQITTEAAGRYGPETQMAVALAAGADMVSLSISEVCRAEANVVAQFLAACRDRGITLQFILYTPDEGALLVQTLGNDALRDPDLQVLFVLGRYGEQIAQPEELTGYLDWMTANAITPDWAICAFGPHEVACLLAAAKHGGKCRVGFENALHLSDGTIAADNAAKVADLRVQLDGLTLA